MYRANWIEGLVGCLLLPSPRVYLFVTNRVKDLAPSVYLVSIVHAFITNFKDFELL